MEERKFEILLYGVIGEDFNGNDMARYLNDMDERADTIHVRINSNGGSVEQGLSLVSAILSAHAYIHVHIDGIAASMAAVIAMCGDKVEMQDFAKLMIHDPYFTNVPEGNLSEKERKCLDSIKDTLQTILSRRGIDKASIAAMMTEETWFTADEAKKIGLADEVTVTPRKDWKNLTASELMNVVRDLMNEKTLNHSEEMKLVAVKLGLPETAAESEVLNKVSALQGELQTVAAERDKLKKELADIEAEKTAAQEKEAASLVDAAVKDGRIAASGKDALLAIFKSDFEKGKALLDAMPKPGKVAGLVTKKAVAANVYAKMTWDELDKAGKLAELKEQDADLYAEKYFERFGVQPC